MKCFHCEEEVKEETAIRLGDSRNLICFGCCEETGIKYKQKTTLKDYGKSTGKVQGPHQGH